MSENTDPYYEELIAKHLSGEASVFESKLLVEWLEEEEANKVLFEECKKIWELSFQSGEKILFDENIAWAKLKPQLEGFEPTSKNKVNKNKKANVIPLSFWSVPMKIAAGFTLLLAFSFILFHQLNKDKAELVSVTTKGHEKKNIFLPDSSQVSLNENSSISYLSDFTRSREVQLVGEAYFDVAKMKGKTFKVKTSKSLTVVLGTTFNIKSNSTQESIQVYSGKVAYSAVNKATNKVHLTKGMQAEINSEGKVQMSKSSLNAIAWKNDKLIFEEDKIETVFATMEEYFGVSIHIADDRVKNCKFTGNFYKPNVEDLFKIIELSTNISYTKENDQYYISGKGCN